MARGQGPCGVRIARSVIAALVRAVRDTMPRTGRRFRIYWQNRRLRPACQTPTPQTSWHRSIILNYFNSHCPTQPPSSARAPRGQLLVRMHRDRPTHEPAKVPGRQAALCAPEATLPVDTKAKSGSSERVRLRMQLSFSLTLAGARTHSAQGRQYTWDCKNRANARARAGAICRACRRCPHPASCGPPSPPLSADLSNTIVRLVGASCYAQCAQDAGTAG